MKESPNINRKWYAVKVILVWTFILIIGLLIADNFIDDEIPNSENELGNKKSCNTIVIPINGYLATYTPEQSSSEDMSSSEDIVNWLSLSEADQEIKALIISIDSNGGDGVAGEEIANALKRLTKLNVAVIRNAGNSAAYLAATGADKIYASKLSDVGGIAFTASYLDQTEKNIKDGYKYIELTSAKYKDFGDPNRPITTEEKALYLADLQKAHDVLVEEISLNRNIEIEDVKRLANGWSYPGMDALNNGLIDEIGDITTAIKYIENKIGIEVDICWY